MDGDSLKESGVSNFAKSQNFVAFSEYMNFKLQTTVGTKVSVQAVVPLDGHFATLCLEADFYEAIFFHY